MAFVLLGLALLSMVTVWRRVLAEGVGARAYPGLIALTGLSLVAAGWVPQDPAPGYDPEQLGHTLPTITGLIHLGVAGVGALASSIALFVMAARFARLPDWPGWATYSRVTGVLTIICVAVYAVWSMHSSGFAGTFERLVVVLPGAWGYTVVSPSLRNSLCHVPCAKASRRSIRDITMLAADSRAMVAAAARPHLIGSASKARSTRY